jgi:hypothetical protein
MTQQHLTPIKEKRCNSPSTAASYPHKREEVPRTELPIDNSDPMIPHQVTNICDSNPYNCTPFFLTVKRRIKKELSLIKELLHSINKQMLFLRKTTSA